MLLKDFETYLISCHYKNNTLESYTSHVRQYFIWADINLAVNSDELLRSHFIYFRNYLKVVRENAPASIKVKTHAMKHFNEFLIQNNIQPNTVIGREDNINLYHRQLEFLKIEKESVLSFISELEKTEPEKYSILATLFAFAGIKVAEALYLKGASIGKTALTIFDAYGGAIRTVEMSPEIKALLASLLTPADSFLFTNAKGVPIHRSRINQVFKKHSKDITPTALRHFYCYELIARGETASVISKRMGNGSEQLIRHYISQWKKI